MRNKVIILALVMVAFLCVKSLGCKGGDQKPKPTEEKKPTVIKVGVILPLTGDMAKYGQTISAAVKLAADELSKNPEPKNFTLDFIFEDDKIDPNTGVSAAMKLINADKVSAIIGPYASSVTLAVASVAERSQIVLLSPGSSSPKITDSGTFIFRNCVSDIYEGNEMAKFTNQNLKLKTLGILYINNDFGVGLKDVFTKTITDLGGSVKCAEAYEQGSTDFKTQLTRIKSCSPDAVYLVGYQEMAQIFKQARELGLNKQLLATTMLNDQSLVDKMGPKVADGTIFAAWEYSPDSSNPRISSFVQRFKSFSGGMDPDVFAANTYDAVFILNNAIKQAFEKTGNYNPTSIKDALYNQSFDGVTGKTSFDQNGDVLKPIVIMTIKDGKITPYETSQ